MRAETIRHHALNVASQVAPLLMPVVVAWLVGPAENAAFYAAWMVLFVIAMVPSALTTVLYSVGIKDRASISKRTRTTLLLSALTTLGAIVGFAVFGDLVLAKFRPDYPGLMHGSTSLLGFGLIGIGIKCHYIAAMRLSGEQWAGARLLAAASLLELALAGLGGTWFGLIGLIAGWLVGQLATALPMVPAIAKLLGRR